MESGEFQFVSFFNQPRRESGLAATRTNSKMTLIWVNHSEKSSPIFAAGLCGLLPRDSLPQPSSRN